MSSGPGVESPLASAASLAKSVYSSCENSSALFQSLMPTIVALREALDLAGRVYDDRTSSPGTQLELESAGSESFTALNSVDECVKRFERSSASSQETWNQLKWGMADVTALRERLIASREKLEPLRVTATRIQEASEIEERLKQLCAGIRNDGPEGTLVSESDIRFLSLDDQQAWNELRKFFESVGIEMDSFIRNREFINAWLREAFEAGKIAAAALGEHGNASPPPDSSSPLHGHVSAAPDADSTPTGSDEHKRDSWGAVPRLATLESFSDAGRQTKRRSDPTTQTSLPLANGNVFPRFLQQEDSQLAPKKRSVFKRALRGLSARISIVREGPESSSKLPTSPRYDSRYSSRIPAEQRPGSSIVLQPGTPELKSKLSMRRQTRNRSNTSRTMVARLSSTGGEIDVATGFSAKLNGSSMKRSKGSSVPRSQSDIYMETDHLLGNSALVHGQSDSFPVIPDSRASLDTSTLETDTRSTQDAFEPTITPQPQRESDLPIARRPSEACSDRSTKRSSRTSVAWNPHERETFDRHNAVMKKAYFERTTEQEKKIDTARRSLQIGPRFVVKPPPPPFYRLAASGLEVSLPIPPPKDDRDLRRHSQLISPPVSMGVSLYATSESPRSSHYANDSTHSFVESDYLPFVMPELLASHSLDSSTVNDLDQLGELKESAMLAELTNPLQSVSVDTPDADGFTPLLRAASLGYPKVVLHLIRAGANILIRTSLDQDALHAAVAGGHLETVYAILDSIPANSISELWTTSVLHTAVAHGPIKIAETLLLNGARLGEKDGMGRTAYEVAAELGKSDMMLLCLEHGARITPLESEGLEETVADGMKEIEHLKGCGDELRSAILPII